MNQMDPQAFNEFGADLFPGYLGINVIEAEPGRMLMELELAAHHLNPNGHFHGGALASLADTACGYGSMASLPEGASGFTTIELKTNFVGTARDGTVTCEATLTHGGRTTQVWDAQVRDKAGSVIAHFRCTQLLIYPTRDEAAS